MSPPTAAISTHTRSSRPKPSAGGAPDWNGAPPCGMMCGPGCAPAQASGRLAPDYGRPVTSHESIYRFIYAQLARTKNCSWRLYLPRGKSERGRRGRRGGNTIVRIPGGTPPLIPTQPGRSPEAADRRTPGHLEAALTQFGNRGRAAADAVAAAVGAPPQRNL